MKKYIYGAYDRNGRLVELSVIAESQYDAGIMARGILEAAREYIDTDEGIYLNDEYDYK